MALVGTALLAQTGAAAPEHAPSQPPAASATAAAGWLAQGTELLLREDPVPAWHAFTAAIAADPADPRGYVGLGRVALLLGRAAPALGAAERALDLAPELEAAMALQVLSLIRARDFEGAARTSARHLLGRATPTADLVAARGSALFRVQRIDEAAEAYRRTVGLEPRHAEAHLRLGSGLLPPTEVTIGPDLRAAVAAARAGQWAGCVAGLETVVRREPGNPVAHRLLGEALYTQRFLASMAATEAAFADLAAALPVPDVRRLPVAEFVPGYRELDRRRAAVVDGAVALFGSRLAKLVTIGATHDLLRELDRTTDAPARRNLRGRRTFDGRVWDDVRGIGGLHAATGIEALDEAAQFGFDTLAHEIAHQVHFYAMTPLQRARIKSLYQRALADGRCLDYYAASNEAEYFGQGVEAFRSFGKRPGGETTHGHTRFELFRVDPDLHDLLAGLVDFDPLAGPAREAVLRAAFAVAMRVGRFDDAVTAAGWLAPGPERERCLAEANAASLPAPAPR